MQEAAPTIGLKIQILNATTIGEIDAAFATLARERPDALFVASDAFFTSRRGQFATLTARERLPAAYPNREYVAAGGLMSYGTALADMYHQVGVYTGNILKGAKPADPRLDAAFAVLVEIVDRNGGIVNKFLGDGFLALFGAPLDDPDAPRRAVTAAREMLAAKTCSWSRRSRYCTTTATSPTITITDIETTS
jgi:hypothetical protein